MKRRLLAMILSVMMILSLLPASAFADDSADATASGEPITLTPEGPAEEPAEEPVLQPITDLIDDPFKPADEVEAARSAAMVDGVLFSSL